MSLNELRERLKINQTGRIVDKEQAERVKAKAIRDNSDNPLANDEEISLNFEKLTSAFEAASKHKFEKVPRETVLKMFMDKKLDEHFVFLVEKGTGDNYTQAMRQVLSRTRKKAAKKKQRLDEFKLLTVSIESKEDHDVVTLVRTKNMTAHEASVYDKLLDAFGARKEIT